MIRPDDFEIRFETTPAGTSVRVRHIPTGNERTRLAAPTEPVGRVREALLAQLRAIVLDPDHIRVDIGRSTGGEFIRVTHIPTGIQQTAMLREHSQEDLLDQVLEEVYGDPQRLRQVCESVRNAE
jgi:protein subunit release factor A